MSERFELRPGCKLNISLGEFYEVEGDLLITFVNRNGGTQDGTREMLSEADANEMWELLQPHLPLPSFNIRVCRLSESKTRNFQDVMFLENPLIDPDEAMVRGLTEASKRKYRNVIVPLGPHPPRRDQDFDPILDAHAEILVRSVFRHLREEPDSNLQTINVLAQRQLEVARRVSERLKPYEVAKEVTHEQVC